MTINCDGVMCEDCPIFDHEKRRCRQEINKPKIGFAGLDDIQAILMALKCMEQRVNIIEDKLGIKSKLRAYPEKKKGGK